MLFYELKKGYEKMKNIVDENTELKRTLHLIDRALVDFRLRLLDLPEENTYYGEVEKCSCSDGECKCSEKELELLSTIDKLKAEIQKKDTTIVELQQQLSEKTEVKVKRQYKERGGSVFPDFKTLTLNEDNNYEGNSVIYHSEDM